MLNPEIPTAEQTKEYSKSLSMVQKIIHQISISKGWYEKNDKRTFGDIIALLHCEISEAMEEYRKGVPPDVIYYLEDSRGYLKPEGIAVEFADVLIRLLDTAAHHEIPLTQALFEKIEYNKTRPWRHGDKKI